MRDWLRVLVIGSISAVCFACSDDESSGGDGTGDGPSTDLADVVFVNEINDEALERLLDKAPADDASQRLEIGNPSAGEVLDKANAATFSWLPAETAALKRPAAPPRRTPWQRFASELGAFVSPIGVAHAHGPAFNGTAYFLVFSTATDDKLLRVFTAARSYTPHPESWDTLVEAGAPITLDITSATFENSLLTTDGGPFVGASVQFTIE